MTCNVFLISIFVLNNFTVIKYGVRDGNDDKVQYFWTKNNKLEKLVFDEQDGFRWNFETLKEFITQLQINFNQNFSPLS